MEKEVIVIEDKVVKIIEELRRILVDFNSRKPLQSFLIANLEKRKYSFTVNYSDVGSKILNSIYRDEVEEQKDFYDKIISGERSRTESTKNLVSTTEISEGTLMEDFLINNNLEDVFYSSYINLNLEDFKKKNLIWFTSQLDQALIHIFDTSTHIRLRDVKEDIAIQPKIFRFKLKQLIKLIKSKTFDNYDIFLNILDSGLIFKIKAKLKEYGISNFELQNNKYILLILEEFNKLVSDEYKIYGYQNYYDQNEIAVNNFFNLVDVNSIKESDYKLISTTQNISEKEEIQILNFPNTKDNIAQFLITDYANREKVDGTKMWRMIMKNKNNTIIYNDFDTGTPLKWTPPDIDEFYKSKYLKYKQKYIELKKDYF